MVSKYIVIGSGPSGVSIAKSLLDSGKNVTMLDFANKVTISQKRNIQNLVQTQPSEWSQEQLERLKFKRSTKQPLKLVYNEDFPYRDAMILNNIILDNAVMSPSLAQGGLSNVWGSAVLPYPESDIRGWPISSIDLLPHYNEVSKLLNISANIDDLSSEYPLPPFYQKRNLLGQSKIFLSHLESKRENLIANGIRFGYARNAFNYTQCNNCGLCMYGCPYELIYSSKQTLPTLHNYEKFEYIEGVFVDRVYENKNQVYIIMTDKNNITSEMVGDKVFLAAGVLGTANIIMKSFQIYDSPIMMKDSPYFIFPLLDMNMNESPNQTQLNTLSQIFIEVNNEQISKNTVHLQVYPMSDLVSEAIHGKFGILKKPLTRPIQYLLSKTMVIQGFFHSAEGQNLSITLNNNLQLLVEGTNHNIDKKIKQIMQILKPVGKSKIYEKCFPGSGFHSGSTFPMINKTTPQAPEYHTDTSGLLNGTNNIHIVDASVLPSIPAQTITFTIMANAHRIGKMF